MDYPESWPQPNGLTEEGASLFATAFSSAAKKEDGWWIRAEGHTAELIDSIKPTRSSKEWRKAVIVFVERLIKDRFECEVVDFGSVPLRTYLPDGDIDLTILARNDLKETWAQDVVKALKQAEEDTSAEFRVKEVQYIQAEVKLIKCLVENIVVDISFNQTGGLATFCFLEAVDRYIDHNDPGMEQNHLFKRSIILVKAWCYYESRILGAHHGLISTYALETLVLYIFHVFHSMRRLRGPLEVLYLFLVYFCNFDWDKYCVSLWGPVPVARIVAASSERPSKTFQFREVAEAPRKDRGRLLLTKEFIENCIYSFNSGVKDGQENSQGRSFNAKFLNVFDPIRDTNNLGRSVNVGSFKRIRSAFGLGARTLGEVLECPTYQINEKFKAFFSCTFKSLERYRSGGRTPTYTGDNIRPQFQFVSRSGQLDTKARSDIDTAEQMKDVLTESTTSGKDTSVTNDASVSCNSGLNFGSTVNTMPSAVGTKQERLKGTEPGRSPSVQAYSIASSEGQWRQVVGKGRYTRGDGDKVLVQNEGSNFHHIQDQSEKPITANRRSPEKHEFASHFKNQMTREHTVTIPSQDPVRWRSSLGDSLRHGDVPLGKNISGSNAPYLAHDGGRPPGASREFKTRSSHGSFHRKNSSSDEKDISTSEKAAAEESGTTSNKRLTHQKDSTSSSDNSTYGNNQNCGNQNMLQPVLNPNPFHTYFPLHTFLYPVQMHLAVSSAIPVPMSTTTGPPSASSLHTTHPSSPSGESNPIRTNSYSVIQNSGILPSTLPAAPSYLLSVAPLGDGAGNHIGGFPPHSEEQRERRRLPLEVQSRHVASVSSTTSPCPPFLIENPPTSIGSTRPGSRTSSMVPQTCGKFKPSSGDRVLAGETTGSQAHGAIDGTTSSSSLSDARQAESYNQLEERVEHVEPYLRNRDSLISTPDVKIPTRKTSKETNGTKQLSRKIKSPSEGSPNEIEVVRSVDGNDAELSLQWLNQPSFEANQASLGNLQAASLHMPLSASTHSYEEMPSVASSNYHKSSAVQSSAQEPGGMVAYQSLQAPAHQGGAGSDPTSSSTLEGKTRSPVSASIPSGPSGSYYPPISEFAAVSVGSSFRNRHIETVYMTVPQPIYNFPTPYYHPHIYVFPTGSDGVVRLDTVGGAHSNGSMDFATDTLGSRSHEDSSTRTMPQVGVTAAERPKGAGSKIPQNLANKMEALHVDRSSQKADTGDPQDDLLCGDLEGHFHALSISFHNSNMSIPSPYSSTRFQQGPQLWERSTRFHGNPHAGPNTAYPVGLATPGFSSRGRIGDGLHQPRNFPSHDNEESLPKCRAGTGTYFPDPRHAFSNRERLRSGGRGGNQYGAYGQQDRKDWEGSNQSHTHRHRNSGQGRGQQNKHDPRAQNMTNYPKNPAADLEGNPSVVQQTAGKRGPPSLSSLPSPTSQNRSSGSPIETNNGYSGMGPSAPPIVIQHSSNDGNPRHSPGLEFGSLGPVPNS